MQTTLDVAGHSFECIENEQACLSLLAVSLPFLAESVSNDKAIGNAKTYVC